MQWLLIITLLLPDGKATVSQVNTSSLASCQAAATAYRRGFVKSRMPIYGTEYDAEKATRAQLTLTCIKQ